MKYTLKKLPDICRISTGKHDANHATSNGMYRFYTCANQYCYCNTKSFSGEAVIVPGNGDIGLVFYYNGDFDAYQRTYVLTDISIYAKYLYYHMLYKWRHVNSGKQFGSTVKYVRMGNFSSYELPVPPLPEQERIVAKIEELFSQLDAAVAELKSVKEKLAIYRQAVLSAAWNSVSGAPMKKTEDICFFITKGTTPPKSALLSKGEVPFLKVYNLTFDNTLDFSIDPTFVSRETHENFLARSKVLPGDVLMNIVGPPLGKVSIVPQLYSEWNINQAIARFRCSEEISNSYLAYFLGSATTVEKIKNKAKATAGQFNLTLEICRNIDMPVPTLDEQLKIVQEIEEKLSVCNNIEQTVDIALQQATALRQSILKQAFEGDF